jgi:EpsI family protein
MTDESRVAYVSEHTPEDETRSDSRPRFEWVHLLIVPVLVAMYWRSSWEMYMVWMMQDSYYSHGFLIPIICLGIAWLKRDAILRAPRDTSRWGYAWVLCGVFMLLLGDFLGFRVFGQLSMIPVLAGVIMLLLGKSVAKALWFPLVFLVFMVPIPPSLTQSVALHLKLIAAECAVQMARLLTLPIVREGSFIHFNGDKLLIGEVCGGLRSLIALLAVGALATYFSKTRPWARAVLIAMTVPIAVIANVFRIFFLCVVGYFYGSGVAAGRVHDISGILIFVVAFALFFVLEAWLRRVAPQKEEPAGQTTREAPKASASGLSLPRSLVRLALLLIVLVGTTAGHLTILNAQAKAGRSVPAEAVLNIPDRIGTYQRVGTDAEIDDRTKRALETSSILIRGYRSEVGWPVELTIVYAGKTRRSLHFPEICLTGGGWDILKQETVPVGILFEGKRLVLVKGDRRQAVLYWFKTGDELTGNYFLNAMYWARNQLTFGTPTSSMIKLTTTIPPGPGGEEAAFLELESMAMQFVPILRERVP